VCLGWVFHVAEQAMAGGIKITAIDSRTRTRGLKGGSLQLKLADLDKKG
jgi:hypothetical protein